MATRTKSRQAAARKGSRMSAVSRRTKAGMRTTKRSTARAAGSARSYVRKNPKKVAAVAVGLAAAGAYALRRRNAATKRSR